MKMKSKMTQLALSLALALAAGSATAAGSAQPLTPGPGGPGAAAGHAAKFTPAQLAEMQARVDLANTIVKNVEADAAAKGATDTWRMGLLSSLYNAPSASLRNIAASARTLDQAHALANTAVTQAQGAASMAKSLGSAADSLVYTPKTPCRFIDTRNVGGPITSTPRGFDTELTSGYGGTSGCTLPGNGEPGFVANVTIVVPAGSPGFIGIRPLGATAVTSFINWESTGTTGLANAGVVTTAQQATGHWWFEVYEGGGNSPQFILDYFGYFSPAPVTALDCYQAGPGATLIGTGTNYYSANACGATYTVTALDCYNSNIGAVYSGGSGVISSDPGPGNQGFCSWTNLTGASQTVRVNATCCRVP
jgi:hypothetical protein